MWFNEVEGLIETHHWAAENLSIAKALWHNWRIKSFFAAESVKSPNALALVIDNRNAFLTTSSLKGFKNIRFLERLLAALIFNFIIREQFTYMPSAVCRQMH